MASHMKAQVSYITDRAKLYHHSDDPFSCIADVEVVGGPDLVNKTVKVKIVKLHAAGAQVPNQYKEGGMFMSSLDDLYLR